MAEKPSEDDKTEGVKLRFEALLTEYRMLMDRIDNRRQMQGQLDNMSLLGLGASISLILVILDRDPNAIGTILLMPILFFAVAFAQLRHERLLLMTAMYIDAELRPSVDKLLSRISTNEARVFGYEEFLSQRSWAPRFLLEWIATASRALLSLAVGMGIFIVYFYVRLALFNLHWNPYETWLLVIDGLMLLGDLTIAFFVARIRYDYLQRNYYKLV